MKGTKCFLFASAAIIVGSCSNNDWPVDVRLQSPKNVSVEQLSTTSAEVTWSDINDETGYNIYLRNADSKEQSLIATTEADVTSFTISSGLQEGQVYFVGVQAVNATEKSRVINCKFNMLVLSELPKVDATTITAKGNCIVAQYTISNIEKYSNVSYGLCWGTGDKPTFADSHLEGPAADAGGKVFQIIPNAALDLNTEYSIRPYISTSEGTYYGQATKAAITKDYDAINLEWQKVDIAGLPKAIEVYKTTSKLEGHNFNAWYAIADCQNADVTFKMCLPSAAQTVKEQAASYNGDCYVMVNGGYFYNGRHTGIAVIDGALSGQVPAVRGSLKTGDDEYDQMYNITRGTFGVDAAGEPAVAWAGSYDKGAKTSYYDTPMASVVGENKYAEASPVLPTSPNNWRPKYALSAGPLLLKDGIIPFDYTKTATGNYLTNYEVMPYDIFPEDVRPDRTAAGYTSDGKIVLFVCDGRITQSDGATLLELARILKGIGCVGAVNFDGGGSTAMVAGGNYLNYHGDQEERAVVSTIGFFKK